MIKYRSGYKYQLAEAHTSRVQIYPVVTLHSEYITLDTSGTLTIAKGYAWDGPSGPAIDTPKFMRPSLVHDALYQLIREGLLTPGYRNDADRILKALCLENGMSRFRVWYTYRAVQNFAAGAAKPGGTKEVIEAP